MGRMPGVVASLEPRESISIFSISALLSEYLCVLSTTISLHDKHISFLLNVACREQSRKLVLMPSGRGMQALKVWAEGPRKALANSIRFGSRDRYI